MNRSILHLLAGSMLLVLVGCSIGQAQISGGLAQEPQPKEAVTVVAAATIGIPPATPAEQPEPGIASAGSQPLVPPPGEPLDPSLSGPQPGVGGATTMNVHREAACGFEISYPGELVVLPTPQGQFTPQPICTVAFQTAVLAQSDVAMIEPPQLTINVYANPNGQPLEEWLRAQSLIRARDEITPAPIGNLQGVRVASQRMMAPNVWWFAARGERIYRLTALGLLGEQMLPTFKAD